MACNDRLLRVLHNVSKSHFSLYFLINSNGFLNNNRIEMVWKTYTGKSFINRLKNGASCIPSDTIIRLPNIVHSYWEELNCQFVCFSIRINTEFWAFIVFMALQIIPASFATHTFRSFDNNSGDNNTFPAFFDNPPKGNY